MSDELLQVWIVSAEYVSVDSNKDGIVGVFLNSREANELASRIRDNGGIADVYTENVKGSENLVWWRNSNKTRLPEIDVTELEVKIRNQVSTQVHDMIRNYLGTENKEHAKIHEYIGGMNERIGECEQRLKKMDNLTTKKGTVKSVGPTIVPGNSSDHFSCDNNAKYGKVDNSSANTTDWYSYSWYCSGCGMLSIQTRLGYDIETYIRLDMCIYCKDYGA